MKTFKDKVAAITGASSGIGRALALELAAHKCHLALSSNSNQKALAETAALAAKHGVKVTTMKVDVAQREQVHAWADQVVKDHGKVNLIINIATASRMSASIADVAGAGAKQNFEKLLRTTAEEAAKVILTGVRRNARRVLVGVDARAGDAMQRLLPGTYQWLVAGATRLMRK